MGLVGFIVCSCRIDQENVSFFYFVEKFSGNFTKSSPFPAVMDKGITSVTSILAKQVNPRILSICVVYC